MSYSLSKCGSWLGCVVVFALLGCGNSDGKTSFPASGGAPNGGAPASGGYSFGGAASGGNAGAATACLERAAPCTISAQNPNPCCAGSCIGGSNNPEWTGCRPLCATSADCDTGCCKPYADPANGGFCVDVKYCSCGAEGSACGSTAPACCDGTYCTGSTTGPGFSCKKKCAVSADCASQCCSQHIQGTDFGVCIAGAPCASP